MVASLEKIASITPYGAVTIAFLSPIYFGLRYGISFNVAIISGIVCTIFMSIIIFGIKESNLIMKYFIFRLSKKNKETYLNLKNRIEKEEKENGGLVGYGLYIELDAFKKFSLKKDRFLGAVGFVEIILIFIIIIGLLKIMGS